MTNKRAIELLDYLQTCICRGWTGDIMLNEEECEEGDNFYKALDVAMDALEER